MARGSQAKEEITAKILEVFEGSFLYDKHIRIPVKECGETIEIKVTLTAAKDIVGDEVGSNLESGTIDFTNTPVRSDAPTEEELKTVKDLLDRLF
jgi:hypothetical protein